MNKREIQIVLIGGTPLERELLASEMSSWLGCAVMSVVDGAPFEFTDASQADFEGKYDAAFKSDDRSVGIVLRV